MQTWEEGCVIAIWGTGFWGKRMYYRCRNNYQIKCFIDNYKRIDRLYTVPVVKASELRKIECKILIAVHEYYSICEQCQCEGKEFYKDYLPYIFFEYQQIPIVLLYDLVKSEVKKYYSILLQNKRPALIIGNCQTSIIKSCMLGSRRFEKEYVFIDIPLVHMLTEHDIDVLQKCKFIFKESSLIITQHISDKAGKILSTDKILEMKGKRSKIVYIPKLWFDLYYPQTIHQYRKAEIAQGIYAFPYGDFVIDELIQKYDEKDTVKIIKNTNIFTKKFLNDLYNYRIANIEEREKKCDIRMLDYIVENWKKELLFFSKDHPNNHVLFEEARRLLAYLGFDDFDSEKVEVEELNQYQEVIYPCVKKAYDLKFKHDYYKDISFEGKKSLDEYVKEYVSYIHSTQF